MTALGPFKNYLLNKFRALPGEYLITGSDATLDHVIPPPYAYFDLTCYVHNTPASSAQSNDWYYDYNDIPSWSAPGGWSAPSAGIVSPTVASYFDARAMTGSLAIRDYSTGTVKYSNDFSAYTWVSFYYSNRITTAFPTTKIKDLFSRSLFLEPDQPSPNPPNPLTYWDDLSVQTGDFARFTPDAKYYCSCTAVVEKSTYPREISITPDYSTEMQDICDLIFQGSDGVFNQTSATTNSANIESVATASGSGYTYYLTETAAGAFAALGAEAGQVHHLSRTNY